MRFNRRNSFLYSYLPIVVDNETETNKFSRCSNIGLRVADGKEKKDFSLNSSSH